MLSLETRRVIKTRDILWLNETYGSYTKRHEGLISSDDLGILPMPNRTREDPDPVPIPVTAKPNRMLRELDTFYNPTIPRTRRAASQSGREEAPISNANEVEVQQNEEPGSKVLEVEEAKPYGMEQEQEIAAMLIEEAFVHAEFAEEEPSTFQQAWDHPDSQSREKWRTAIKKEFKDMNNRKVWRKIERSQLPSDRRCVKSKWVFKIKRNGVYRARLVACGYSQIPGVDFSEVPYSPVINDVTYRIMIMMSVLFGYSNVIIDVETAFLHGELGSDEEIYMECPPGLECGNNKILILEKTIYGLVQAAKAFYKKLC